MFSEREPRRMKYSCCAILVCFQLVGCDASSEPAPAALPAPEPERNSSGVLKLTFSLGRATYIDGEPLVGECVLTNTGPSPLAILVQPIELSYPARPFPTSLFRWKFSESARLNVGGYAALFGHRSNGIVPIRE